MIFKPIIYTISYLKFQSHRSSTTGILAANRADEDFQNSVLENCGEQETIKLTTYKSICEGFNCVANCPTCACANGAATGATAAVGIVFVVVYPNVKRNNLYFVRIYEIYHLDKLKIDYTLNKD